MERRRPYVGRVREWRPDWRSGAPGTHTCDPQLAMCLEPFGRLATGEIGATLAVNLAAPVALANLFCRGFADADMPRQVINVSSGAAQTAQQVTPS